MKRINLASASRTLAEYAAELTDDIVVLVDGGKAVAAIVPLAAAGPASLALSNHPKFLNLIGRARQSIERGETVTLADMRRAFAAGRSAKSRPRAATLSLGAVRRAKARRRAKG